MITGDHKTTAQAIGRDIGLMTEKEIAVTGQELDAMSDEELDNKLEQIGVYARVSPRIRSELSGRGSEKAKSLL